MTFGGAGAGMCSCRFPVVSFGRRAERQPHTRTSLTFALHRPRRTLCVLKVLFRPTTVCDHGRGVTSSALVARRQESSQRFQASKQSLDL